MKTIAKDPIALAPRVNPGDRADTQWLLLRIVRKDFLRKKIITAVVFAFILLSALLVASGSNLIVELSSSLNALFETAKAPHFVQMHVGPLDQDEIDRWAAADDRVLAQQTVEMITIDGSDLYLGESQSPEENSIMDISFVKQNASFDFLLDLDNRVIELNRGEVAVPVYYMQAAEMKLGDRVTLRNGTWYTELTVAAFVRDAMMNPSTVHSKRFLVHDADYTTLKEHFQESEYLIEFRLRDTADLGEFSRAYLSSSLPARGPAVDYTLFKAFNALTDGIVAGGVILLSLLLMTIALLCLRFTILATLEEEYRQIGVMKAIGIARSDIRQIYLAKYVAVGALASLLGYLGSLYLNRLLSGHLALYVGTAPKSLLHYLVPLAAAMLIFLVVIVSCLVVLRRFNQISAVEALRSGSVGDSLNVKWFPLHNSRVANINLWLGFRDVIQRGKLFGLLCFVFFFCTVLILLPVLFLTTIQSPTFISYMGIGRSDLRVDLRQSDEMSERFAALIAYLESDPDVERFAPLVTAQYTLLQNDGSTEKINIETGDFSLFPLDYVEGFAPQHDDEIALSILNADGMEKRVGDTVVILLDGKEHVMTVSGIYQDITNGGRTAKAVFPFDPQTVRWYTVSLDLKSPDRIAGKVREYAEAFHPARVTDLEGYVAQTMGETITQYRLVTIVAVVVGLFVAILITSMFLNMLITKDSSQIAILRSLGFSLRDLRIQYLIRSLTLLAIGITLGTLFANTLGQRLVSALWSMMGASQIRFVVDPLLTYLFFPLLLMLTVSLTTLVSIRGVKESNIAEMIVE
jgi:putative ABC transport system permease protein